jgi:hypothetical protein
MKRRRILVRLSLALMAGSLSAGLGTKLRTSCPPLPDDAGSGCVSFVKAVWRPAALLTNEQGTLVRFLALLAVTSVVTLALIAIVDALRTGRSPTG